LLHSASVFMGPSSLTWPQHNHAQRRVSQRRRQGFLHRGTERTITSFRWRCCRSRHRWCFTCRVARHSTNINRCSTQGTVTPGALGVRHRCQSKFCCAGPN